ncbi:NmrA family protein, partial [Sinorhizobium meliloti]
LGSLPIEAVSLRPNAWMQVSLANIIRQVVTSDQVVAANLDAGIGYIDARDIADVAVQQLLADRLDGRTLNLTGPDIVSFRQIASLMAAALKRSVAALEEPPQIVPQDGDFEHRAVAQFVRLIAAGRAATTTDVVRTLLGRSPRTVAAFILEQVAPAAAVPEYQP